MNIHSPSNHQGSITCKRRQSIRSGVKVLRHPARTSRRQPLNQSRVAKADGISELIFSLIPINEARLLRKQALVNARQQDYESALEIFSALIDCDPNNALDYNNRGLVYFQSGQMVAAIQDYNTALYLNPNLDHAYNNRGNYYAAHGLYKEAIADYDRAIDLNPCNLRARINQGITFRDLGQYDEALESFDLAHYLGSTEVSIFIERGRTYHLRGDWNCAIADYRRALAQLQSSQHSQLDTSCRRLQVEAWLAQLLQPLSID
ncbi:MAG: tetratricopeptide repeat protein [Cyanothece sp. SIO1E1]|nr:tetratricopeptide repeat protein [Cyanothece sp. SIO1E1]